VANKKPLCRGKFAAPRRLGGVFRDIHNQNLIRGMDNQGWGIHSSAGIPTSETVSAMEEGRFHGFKID